VRRLGHLAVRASGGSTPADAEREARASINVIVHIEKIDGLRKVRELLQLPSV
jgi:2-keto-3-deoxy-L-rhamnonate aldolase RhmA